MPEIYIIISIVSLAIIAVFLFLTKKIKPQAKLSKLAMFAFLLIILGIVFGNDHLIGYSFMGAGVIIAIIDIIKNLRNKQSYEGFRKID